MKKILLFIVVLVGLFSVCSVSASDMDDIVPLTSYEDVELQKLNSAIFPLKGSANQRRLKLVYKKQAYMFKVNYLNAKITKVIENYKDQALRNLRASR